MINTWLRLLLGKDFLPLIHMHPRETSDGLLGMGV